MGKNICYTCLETCKQSESSVIISCKHYRTQDMLDNPPEKKKRKTKIGTVERIDDPLISIEDEIINQLSDFIIQEPEIPLPKQKRKYTKRSTSAGTKSSIKRKKK